MRILICYGTTEGQTRKIAEFIADVVKRGGHEPALFDATAVSELEYSAGLLASTSKPQARTARRVASACRSWRANT